MATCNCVQGRRVEKHLRHRGTNGCSRRCVDYRVPGAGAHLGDQNDLSQISQLKNEKNHLGCLRKGTVHYIGKYSLRQSHLCCAIHTEPEWVQKKRREAAGRRWQAAAPGWARDLRRLPSACYYEPSPSRREEKVFDAMPPPRRSIRSWQTGSHALGDAFAAAPLQGLPVGRLPVAVPGPMQPLALHTGPHGYCGDDSTTEVASTGADGDLIGEDFDDLPDHASWSWSFFTSLFFAAMRKALYDYESCLGEGEVKTRFLSSHLGGWSSVFTVATAHHAETAFYRDPQR